MNEEFSILEYLLLKHAGLIQLDTKIGILLQGTVKIKGKYFNVKLMCPNYPNLEGLHLQIQCQHTIKTILHEINAINKDWSVEDILENIPNMANETRDCEERICSPLKNNQNIYAEIASLYLPTEYQMEINESCSQIRFGKFVQNENDHFLKVELPSLRLLEHSLPICVDWQEILAKTSSLTSLLHQFRKYLEDLQLFYENLTDIDELCHVVQPSLPTTKENWRLLVLKERVFLKLQFADPFAPLSSMGVDIIGPTSEVAHLRRVYSEGLRDWDGELDVHKNLLRIFDLCFFPLPPDNGSDSEDNQQYCNICYSYKLDNGEIPIISCDNTHCSLIFHAECLKEWFSTLAEGKYFLDVAFAACPFCKSKISTSFQEIFNAIDTNES